MPRMYPATVRRQIVSRLRSGEAVAAVAAVAAETGVCQATLFRWKRPALIDASDRKRGEVGRSGSPDRERGGLHRVRRSIRAC